ncbi:MAG: hypothetical protein LBK28_09385, partial [Propionibacteriaceae bacterium]|nr:hypothetical protein [Propionibacteriaceae bacterium]
MTGERQPLDWRQVSWPRPLSPEAAAWLLRQMASASGLCPMVFEAWGAAGKVRHLVGTRPAQADKLAGFMTANLTDLATCPLLDGSVSRRVDSAAVVRLADDAQPLDVGQSL